MPQLPTGTVTLLFTEIEGATLLLQQLRSDYSSVLASCRQLLHTAFSQHNGHEVDTRGESFFVVFARATDAVAAAVTAQQSLASHSWSHNVKVRVRMGLHTGEPYLTDEGYVGSGVHQAARIMLVASGGQILLSQTTRDLVEQALPEGVSLQAIGAHHLKDMQYSIHLFQLIIKGLPHEFPMLKPIEAHLNNLPIPPTPLIGRVQEVEVVRTLLNRKEVRLLTLTGPGGTGKTRLGLQVATEQHEQFRDGVYFVNLAPIRDPEMVLVTIAQTLVIRETGTHPMADLLTVFLRDKHLLLLLDNFEQVLVAAPQIANLLARCPHLKIVVTSRAALRVRGEQEFSVPPLAVPDPKHLPDLITFSQCEAVTLFLRSTQAVKPDFQLTNFNAAAIAEICVRLDGLPLAIELASARGKLLPPQALLVRLGHSLAILTNGARDMPQRQQTLRNTIAWSYDLLDAAEQRLFRRLSIFVGSCTLEAIEALCTALDGDNEPGQILDRVASLIDMGLLRQTERELEETRFWMLETLREFAQEALATSGEEEAVLQAHAKNYLQLATEVVPHLYGADEQGWSRFASFEQDHENLKAALHWFLDHREAKFALLLSTMLWWFWLIQGHLNEGCTFLEQALAMSEEATKAERAEALNGLGLLLVNAGNNEQAERRIEESLALYRELGDTMNMGWPFHNLGLLAMDRGEYPRARLMLEESLALFSEVRAKDNRAFSLCHLAQIYSEQGESIKARASAEESVALFKESGHSAGLLEALFILVWVLFDSRENTATIETWMNECLMLTSKMGNIAGIADRNADIDHLAAEIALGQGDLDRARSLIEKSLTLDTEKDYNYIRARAAKIVTLAQITTAEGDYAAARAYYEENLVTAREIGDYRITLSGLEGIATVAAAQGMCDWAARLWGAGDILRETIGKSFSLREYAKYEKVVTDTRIQLGEKDFAAAWAWGRTMTPEQALASERRAMNASPISTVLPFPDRMTRHALYPDGLTTREVEVLRLLATGLTNAQLGEQLIISPRTVDSHLTSIYSKIGVSSRSAATRYALDHHLV